MHNAIIPIQKWQKAIQIILLELCSTKKWESAIASSVPFLALRLTIRRFGHFLWNCDLCASCILLMHKCASTRRVRCCVYPNQPAAYRPIRMLVSDSLFVPRYADVLSFERNAFIRSFVVFFYVCMCSRRKFISFCLDWNMKSERDRDTATEHGMQTERISGLQKRVREKIQWIIKKGQHFSSISV